jgi:hypothetical protein
MAPPNTAPCEKSRSRRSQFLNFATYWKITTVSEPQESSASAAEWFKRNKENAEKCPEIGPGNRGFPESTWDSGLPFDALHRSLYHLRFEFFGEIVGFPPGNSHLRIVSGGVLRVEPRISQIDIHTIVLSGSLLGCHTATLLQNQEIGNG